MTRRLLVIIPTLNEAINLPAAVRQVREGAVQRPRPSILVSDCCSADGTADVARGLGCSVIGGGVNRSDAMNRAAFASAKPLAGRRAADHGDILLFLHADSRLPDGYDRSIRRAIADGAVGGCFEFSFAPHHPHQGRHARHHGMNRPLLGAVTLINRVRYRLGCRYYGDQGIFVRRDVFERLGGFPPVPLLEDARFSRSMSRLGRTAVLRPAMQTSPRRFVDKGVMRQFLADIRIVLADNLGLLPQGAGAEYQRHNHDAGRRAEE